jgi:phage protein D
MDLSLPFSSSKDPADCIIKVDGQEITDLYPFLTQLSVESSRENPSTATLVFETLRDEQGKWTVQDKGILIPWKPIKIEAAFGTRTEEIMRGYIREVRADYPAEVGSSTVTVECQDDSLALDRKHVRKPWGVDTPVADGDILQQIISDHPELSVDSDSGTGLSSLVLNQDESDIKFLRRRAEANGYELYFREGSVYFGPMRLSAKVQPTILVYAGPDTNCISLSVKTDGHLPNAVGIDVADTQGTGVTHTDIKPDLSPLGKQPADAGGDGLDDFTWMLSREGSFDSDELTARAQKKANDFSMRVSADGELDGSMYGHVLLPGLPVSVDGAGDWLGGTYYVDTVSHIFTTDGYRQTIRLLRNAYGDDGGGGGGGLLGLL